MAVVVGRGGNRTWNCFICGREGHFAIACPEKNKQMVPVAKPEVNLISSEALVYTITRSKAADERLNIREEYNEARRASQKQKDL